MNLYTISAYKHSATLIKGVQNSGISPNLQQMVLGGAGAPNPSFVGVGQIDTQISFACSAIKTALANCGGITGAALSSDTFYLQKFLEGGLRAGTLSHIKIVAATGMLIPQSIQAAQGQPAAISYIVIPTSSDGVASPLAFTGSQTLEAGQDVNTEVYTMGPVSINGTALDGVDSWSLDFGNVPWKNTADGSVYPTEVGVQSQAPAFTIQTRDIEKFQTWGLDGIAQGASDSTVQLLDQAAGGVRGSTPITFTIDEGMVHFESINGADGQQLGGQVIIRPVYDGTNAIIALTGI